MVAVILSYVFISLVTILFRAGIMEEHLSIIAWLFKITNFSAIAYGWYIEMWIGLYLLTPFLNILWKNIESKKHRLILIVTLYLLCAFPDSINKGPNCQLIPAYWQLIYPCIFYFVGAYIREYQPIPKKLKIFTFIVLCCLVNPLLNIVFYQSRPILLLLGSGVGIVGVPLAAAIFLLCYRIDLSTKWLCTALTSVSKLSLDMYLSSYMFDLVIYKYFHAHFYMNQSQFGAYFFAIIPIVFMCSYLFAVAKRWLFSQLHLPTK